MGAAMASAFKKAKQKAKSESGNLITGKLNDILIGHITKTLNICI
jgi:hypothetical protein